MTNILLDFCFRFCGRNVTILELSQTATRLFDNSDATWGDGVTLNIRGLKSSDPEAPARITHIKVGLGKSLSRLKVVILLSSPPNNSVVQSLFSF